MTNDSPSLDEQIKWLKTLVSEYKKLASSNRKEADELRAALGIECDCTHKEALEIAATLAKQISHQNQTI